MRSLVAAVGMRQQSNLPDVGFPVFRSISNIYIFIFIKKECNSLMDDPSESF